MEITSLEQLRGVVRGSLEYINIVGEWHPNDIVQCMTYLKYGGTIKIRGIDSIELSRLHVFGNISTEEFIKYAHTVKTNINELMTIFKNQNFVINFADIQDYIYYVIEGEKCL